MAENAKSAIMIEATTGEILYKKNEKERLAPASMTKIMSLILIMENIESGKLKWNDIVVTSNYASSMGGSQVFLKDDTGDGENALVPNILLSLSVFSYDQSCLFSIFT